jgi:hypothetical protein
MFLFARKNSTVYKPKVENNLSSYSKTNIEHFIAPMIENNTKPNLWRRQAFDKSKDDEMDYFISPYPGTLVSSLTKETQRNTENYLVVLCKNMYYLGAFFGKWLGKQMRYTGFLCWFHPWIVNRHRYFYRGY